LGGAPNFHLPTPMPIGATLGANNGDVLIFKAASYGGRPRERPLPKLPIYLAERRNSWSYSSSSRSQFGFLFLSCPNSWLRGETFGTKTPKKCYHVDNLVGILLWATASRVKAQRTNFHSPPIKLLEFLLLSTFGHYVKRPLLMYAQLNPSKN
jgi:hypothetical protein